MIAKYPGRCRYCKESIQVGTDEYDLETKTSFHWDCHDNPKPTPECYRIADELGFRPVGAAIQWSQIPSRRTMQFLLQADRNRPERAQREDDTTRGRQNSLFGLREEESA